jgi:mono/diheme cytochrome c family protein
MSKASESHVILAAVILFAGAMGFAQTSGEATYKAKCQNCHGPDGMASSGIGKIMKVKPVNDPEVRKQTEEAMIDAVRNGEGKMQAYKGSLTDAQIKDSVDYFRRFIK